MYKIMHTPFFGIFRKQENQWQIWSHGEWFGKEEFRHWVPVLDKEWTKIINALPVVSVCDAFTAIKEWGETNEKGHGEYHLREFAVSTSGE